MHHGVIHGFLTARSAAGKPSTASTASKAPLPCPATAPPQPASSLSRRQVEAVEQYLSRIGGSANIRALKSAMSGINRNFLPLSLWSQYFVRDAQAMDENKE